MLRHERIPRQGLAARIAMSIAVVAAAVSVASLGTFASWTTTTEASTGLMSTGTVDALLNGTAGLAVDVANLAPDDSMQRLATFKNAGTIDLSSVSLSATGTQDFAALAPYLDIDVASCDLPWTPQGSRFTCAGVQSTALAMTTVSAVNATPTVLSNVALAANAETPLRITMRLQKTAPKSAQGKTTRITYSLATQARAGIDR